MTNTAQWGVTCPAGQMFRASPIDHQTHSMKTITAVLSVIACLLAFQSRCGAAVLVGPVTNINNGHIYYLLTASTWTQAQAEAQSLGGNLVTINDQSEQLWVYSAFAFYQSQPRQLWIGLTDRDTEGVFTWVNGDLVTYTNWGNGEPNDAGGLEDYASIWASDGPQPSKWNDVPNSQPGFGVVEIAPRLALVIRVSEVAISWHSQPAKNYQVQFKDSVSDTTWANLGPVKAGTGSTLEYTDSVTEPGRIYQVIKVP